MGSWLLLDNQSSTDIFKDASVLSDIREVNTTLVLHTSGGTLYTNKMGTYKGYGDVWYHPEALTNIISFAKARNNGYGVKHDDSLDEFTIMKNGTEIIFKRKQNLYVTPLQGATKLLRETRDVQLLNTVAELKSHYSKKEYENTLKAQDTFQKLVYPSI